MPDSKLKILIISDVNSAHIHNWVEYLTTAGHHVTLLSVRPGLLPSADVIYHDPGDDGSKLHRIAAHARFLWKEWRLIATGGFDIVHVHFLRADAIGWVATLHPNSVISVWGSDARLVAEGGDGRRLWLKRAALRRAKLITATNEFLKNNVLKIEPYSHRIEVVSFGVPKHNLTVIDKNQSSVRFIFAKPNLIQLYGIDTLIEAFIEVSRQLPDVKLTVVGEGETVYVNDIKEKLKSSGNEARVRFTGRLNRSDLFNEMLNCDIMVQPSRWESHGVVMLEGMSVGLPVISTDVGGVPEIVRDNITGIIVPPDDVKALSSAMMKLTTDKSLRDELGQAGRKVAALEYDFNIHGAKMVRLYRELTNK